MNKEYNNQEMAKDLLIKDMRIQGLEKDLKKCIEKIEILQRKLSIAIEGLSHIDNPIARETEREISEA